MDIRNALKESIASSLNGLGISVEVEKVPLEHPAELKNGDYSSGVALQYAKQAGSAPRVLADKIAAALGTIDGIAKIEVAGAGFINFYLTPAALAGAVEMARKEDMWGSGTLNAGKKIMVEYTDPNPFKEFHIGHLMSNAIGESIARLMQFSGADVKRANYQGDVGPHVAKTIWGMEQNMEEVSSFLNTGTVTEKPAFLLGKWYAFGANAYEKDENAKKKIDEINVLVYKIVAGETTHDQREILISNMYKTGKAVSLAAFKEIYDILGTKFDYNFFESETAPLGVELVKKHPKVFVKSDGATVYHGPHTRVFITSKGLPTYETKELGLAELKAETWPFDISITITAHEQRDYFEVVLAAMKEVLPDIASKIRHISHGMMRFAEGKMSSRTGNVITGESLLNDLVDAAKVRAKESRTTDAGKLSEEIAVAAVKYQILKQASGKDIIFDRERALSLEGDSGPYLQYAHARAHQVVGKARASGIEAAIDAEAPINDVVRLMYRFPEIVERAAELREPHILTNYLTAFAAAFNSWYAQEQILDGTPAAAHKVALVDAVRRTLKNGLWVLGIPAPEQM